MIRLPNSSPKSLVPYVLPGIIALKTDLWRRQGRTKGGSLAQQTEYCWAWKVGVFLNSLNHTPRAIPRGCYRVRVWSKIHPKSRISGFWAHVPQREKIREGNILKILSQRWIFSQKDWWWDLPLNTEALPGPFACGFQSSTSRTWGYLLSSLHPHLF